MEEPEVVDFLDSDSEKQSQGEEELANPPNPTHSEPLVDSTNVPSSSGDRIGFMSDPACLEEIWEPFTSLAHVGNTLGLRRKTLISNGGMGSSYIKTKCT